MLPGDLDHKDVTEIHWTGSKVVLGSTNNVARGFHVFFENRVQHIRDHLSKDQWNHFESKRNPADESV